MTNPTNPTQLHLDLSRNRLKPDDDGTLAKQAHKGDPGKDARASKARQLQTNHAPTEAELQHWKSPCQLSQEALRRAFPERFEKPHVTAAAKARSHTRRE